MYNYYYLTIIYIHQIPNDPWIIRTSNSFMYQMSDAEVEAGENLKKKKNETLIYVSLKKIKIKNISKLYTFEMLNSIRSRTRTTKPKKRKKTKR
jgi:hypothetical protein